MLMFSSSRLVAASTDDRVYTNAVKSLTDGVWDRAETELALSRTGKDVGTPILTFKPGRADEGSFFGPVLSKAPRGQAAVDLWNAVELIATTSGMAELKRSNRGRPEFD